MRAVLFDKTLHVVSNYPRPARGPGQSLIRVRCAGICNTDIEISRGYMNYSGVLGHEFAGVVEETDDPKLQGKRVVGEINLPCGICQLCRAGLRTHCSARTVLGIAGHPGAMADYCVLPNDNLHELPPNITDQEAVFCEPIAAAFEILMQISIQPKHQVIVLGDGKLGLLAAQVIKTTGADVRLLGRSPKKSAIARSLSIETAERKDFAPNAADIVIECTGSADGLSLALQLVRPRGTIVLKSTVAEKYHIDLAPVVINEILVVGSRCGPFAPAIRSLAESTVRVNQLITAVFAIEDAQDAFARASERDSLKILLRFE